MHTIFLQCHTPLISPPQGDFVRSTPSRTLVHSLTLKLGVFPADVQRIAAAVCGWSWPVAREVDVTDHPSERSFTRTRFSVTNPF